MPDPLKPAVEAARTVADAVTGPGTPDSVKVIHRDDRLATIIKAASGPAVSAMLIACVLLTANWVPWLGKLEVWSPATEEVRAKGITLVTIILACCVGVVLWVSHVGRPSRTEISAGPVGVKIDQESE